MFSNPQKNIAKLKITEGMKIADLGSGTGFYSKILSQKVGHTGKVYAIEVQKNLVKKLRDDLKLSKISNIECLWGDVEKIGGTKLADKIIDVVIASNIFFQIEDKLGFLDEIKRILKPKGKVLLINLNNQPESLGFKIGNNKNTVEEIFIKRGFKKLEDIHINNHHYGIIFKYE